MRRAGWLCALAVLGACENNTDGAVFQAENPEFYTALPGSYPLRGVVYLKDVGSAKGSNAGIAQDFRHALGDVLKKAHMLAPEKQKGQVAYQLSARVMDYSWRSTGLMHVRCTTVVQYRLWDADNGQEVLRKTISASYEQRKALLGNGAEGVPEGCGTAFGNNAVQAAQELARLKPKNPIDPAHIPLKRLKGAL